MTSDYPAWLEGDDGQPARPDGVNWAALPDGWRDLNHRLSRPAGLDRRGHANVIRAQVVEGLIGPENLSFAYWLAGHG